MSDACAKNDYEDHIEMTKDRVPGIPYEKLQYPTRQDMRLEITRLRVENERLASQSFTYNWRWAYNVAVYAFHSVLTGHPVIVNFGTGKPSCTVEKH